MPQGLATAMAMRRRRPFARQNDGRRIASRTIDACIAGNVRHQTDPARGSADTPTMSFRIAVSFTLVILSVLALTMHRDARADEDAVPTAQTTDSIEARVQGCVTCHGRDGAGTRAGYFPRIAGKPAGYLYNQLLAFRDGTRRYPPMNYLVAYLPDAYLHEIAVYYAKQHPPFAGNDASTVAPSILQRGAELATAGDADRQVPACIACHGRGLTGMEPGIPGLAGLQSTYIAAQLTRWRVGERHAMEPDCMKRIASRLSDTDVAAVASWLSIQHISKDATPDSFDRVRMPLACGSQQASQR